MLLYFLFHLLLFFFGTTKLFDFQKYLCEHGYVQPDLWTLHGDTNNFNIALPDSYAVYKGSFVCLSDQQTLVISGEVPQARYYSVQVYDSTTRSLGSLNDNQIKLNSNGFSINITKNSTDVSANSNVLKINTPNTFLIVLLRLYDTNDTDDTDDTDDIKLPQISKMGKSLAHANHTIINFPRIYRNKKPIREHRFANEPNNFFKPIVASYFNNDDANYLISLIKVNQTERLGAIITGYLPVTSSETNTSNDYFKTTPTDQINQYDDKYYEVRYASFNMGTTSFPLPTIGGNILHSKFKDIDPRDISSTGKPGIRDVDIIKRYSGLEQWSHWGRPYQIYIGIDLDHIRELGGDPNVDLYLIYPVSYQTGELFTYASVIYRHVLPQSKFLDNPLFNQSVSDIVGNPAIPSECKEVMGAYYPEIKFVDTSTVMHA